MEEEKEQGKVTGGQTEAHSGYRKGQGNMGGKERKGTAGLSHLRVRALPDALRRRSLLDWVWRLVEARNQVGGQDAWPALPGASVRHSCRQRSRSPDYVLKVALSSRKAAWRILLFSSSCFRSSCSAFSSASNLLAQAKAWTCRETAEIDQQGERGGEKLGDGAPTEQNWVVWSHVT